MLRAAGRELVRLLGAEARAAAAERCGLRPGERLLDAGEHDPRALPYADETFDAALAAHVLGGLPPHDRARALDELRRVLRPLGRLVVINLTEGGWRLHEQLAPLLGLEHPVCLAPLLTARFKDVSRVIYSRLGLRFEVLRAVKL